MSDVFFWGLTYKDFENSFWNDLSNSAVLFTGMAVAVTANLVAQVLIDNNSSNRGRNSSLKPLVSTLTGIGAGVVASIYVGNRLPYVTFVAEKALKLLVITVCTSWTGVIPLITAGGVGGYFGRPVLYLGGTLSALVGSAYATMFTSR